MEGQASFHYCHGCGEQVLTYTVQSELGVELRCSYCGLALGRQAAPAVEVEGHTGCVLLADNEKLLRTVLRDLLLEQQLAQAVVACESGAELLSKITERLCAKERTQLVILDILLRDLDGVAVAKAIRAVERGFGITWPVPILFLSGLRPDTAIRNFVARVQPALFLNKAVDATPDRLAVRLRKMVDYFDRVRSGASGGAPSL